MSSVVTTPSCCIPYEVDPAPSAGEIRSQRWPGTVKFPPPVPNPGMVPEKEAASTTEMFFISLEIG